MSCVVFVSFSFEFYLMTIRWVGDFYKFDRFRWQCGWQKRARSEVMPFAW